jgi:hypothetical protein
VGDPKDLGKDVPVEDLNHAKVQREKGLNRKAMSGIEWARATTEAEIK